MRTLFLIVLAVISFTFVSFSQEQPVHWQFKVVQSDSGLQVIAKAEIESGWYVYSQYLESDDGPIPTHLMISDSLLIRSKATEEGPSIYGYDNMFGMDIKKFKKEMLIRQPIHNGSSQKLEGYVEFMTCNDEMCLPPRQIPFILTIP